MRLLLLTGMIAATLSATPPASAQDTILSGILSGALPGSRVTWSSGVGDGVGETYEDLFIEYQGGRARVNRIHVVPDGARASVEAEGLVINPDGDETVAIEIGTVRFRIGVPHLTAIGDPSRLSDLCALGPDATDLEAQSVRFVRDLPAPAAGERAGRAETRITRASVQQRVLPGGPGCTFEISLDVTGHREFRSDQSGTTIDGYKMTLMLPGNLATLASASAPDLTLSALLQGVERRLPGGAAAVGIGGLTLDLRMSALSAVPALSALLRSRGAPRTERAVSLINALIPADMGMDATLRGVTLRADALIPAQLISGLSRGSLSNLIGEYDLSGTGRGGQLRLSAGSRIIGVGETGALLSLRLSPFPDGASPFGPGQEIEKRIPPAHLDLLEITHRDDGLLGAIELITGFPVSVMAAIYLQEGVNETPEPWRAASRLAVSDLAQFFALTTSGGGRLSVTTPTGLSLQETYVILPVRPDLTDELVLTRVGPAVPN